MNTSDPESQPAGAHPAPDRPASSTPPALPAEVPTPRRQDDWTDDQWARAERSGLLDRLEERKRAEAAARDDGG